MVACICTTALWEDIPCLLDSLKRWSCPALREALLSEHHEGLGLDELAQVRLLGDDLNEDDKVKVLELISFHVPQTRR